MAWAALSDSSSAVAFILIYVIGQRHCTCFLLGPHAAVQTDHCRGYAARSAKAADVRCSRLTHGSESCFSALRACSTSPLAMADRGLAYDVHHQVRWHLHAYGPLQRAPPPVDDGKLLRITRQLHCSCMYYRCRSGRCGQVQCCQVQNAEHPCLMLLLAPATCD